MVDLPAYWVVLLQVMQIFYTGKKTDNETEQLQFWSTLKSAWSQTATSAMGRTWVFSYGFSPFQRADSNRVVHEKFPHLLTTVQGHLFIQEPKPFTFQKMVLLSVRLSGVLKLNIPDKSQVFPSHVTISNAWTFYTLSTSCIADWFL
jgi:hypothetical protein